MIRWEQGEDGVVVLTFDDPARSVNTMNDAYVEAMDGVLAKLESECDQIAGVILTSAKTTFFAGGDLDRLIRADRGHAAELMAHVTHVKAQLRRLETLHRPVVAAINGSALGGGLEIALACHHRIAVADPRVEIGLPEVTLGLLPGAGGVVRSVRMLGLATALTEVLLRGQRHHPARALELGLVDHLVEDPADLLPAARTWIAAHPDTVQPWDTGGYRIPGGTPATPALAAVLPTFPATLRAQLKGAPYPAPRHILAAAVESTQVDLDTALTVESRYFIDLACGQIAKNMIQAFFDLRAANADQGSREIFASRVTEAFSSEGLAMVAEGIEPTSVEQASSQAGYLTPALAMLDGDRRELLRPGLGEHLGLPRGSAPDVPFEDLMERLLFIEAIESVKCLDEGVLTSAADANVGSILGFGFPGWTGGVLQYVNGYPGGPAGFVTRARELAARYGERFTPPPSLAELAETGGRYPGPRSRS